MLSICEIFLGGRSSIITNKFLIPDESISYAKAIWLALGKKMEEDKRVLVYGLGVDDHKAMYQTLSEFPLIFGPNRCFDTPLSEDSLTGYGIGYGTETVTQDNSSFENDIRSLITTQITQGTYLDAPTSTTLTDAQAQGQQTGNLSYTVPVDAPDSMFYAGNNSSSRNPAVGYVSTYASTMVLWRVPKNGINDDLNFLPASSQYTWVCDHLPSLGQHIVHFL